jgi:HlyD family secretion protein
MQLETTRRRNHRLRWGLLGALLTIAVIPAAGRLTLGSAAAEAVPAAGARAAADRPITAPGRIEPRDGVIAVAAPASLTGPAIVSRLLAFEGDWVREGQPLATLRGREELATLVVGKERQRDVAAARLVALQSGGKDDDVRALQADVDRDAATLAHVEADASRSRLLHADGLLDTASWQAQEARLAIAARALEASRARLRSLSSVRPADVAVAAAELRAADTAVDEARATLDAMTVRAPADGRVIAVHAQPGQAVGVAGVLSLGKTAWMYVDAEVLEEDIPRTRVGQPARITGDVLPNAVDGTVEEIGGLVGSREVFTTDPAAFADSRVVHVKIRIPDPARLERFIHGRVTAVIQP